MKTLINHEHNSTRPGVAARHHHSHRAAHARALESRKASVCVTAERSVFSHRLPAICLLYLLPSDQFNGGIVAEVCTWHQSSISAERRQTGRQMTKWFRGSGVAPERPDIKGSSGKPPDTPRSGRGIVVTEGTTCPPRSRLSWEGFSEGAVVFSKCCSGASMAQAVNCDQPGRACGHSWSTVGVPAEFGPERPFSSAVIPLCAFISGAD